MNSVIDEERGVLNLLSQTNNVASRPTPSAAAHFTPTKNQDASYRK